MNFSFDFLQELLMVWEAISNIREGVSSDIQTPWSWLRKTRLRLVFSTTSRCLDIGWNTLPRVWYITSQVIEFLEAEKPWAGGWLWIASADQEHIPPWVSIYKYPQLAGWVQILIISLASYTKIFPTLRYHQAQAEDPVQHQPSQLNVLNIAQYRKAVHSALWVKLALVVCIAPFFIVVTAMAHSKTHSSHLVILRGITVVLITLTRR